MDGEISMDGDAMEDIEGMVERFSARSIPTFSTWAQLRFRNTDPEEQRLKS